MNGRFFIEQVKILQSIFILILLVLSLLLVQPGCDYIRKNDHISERTILKIGDLQISEYEVQNIYKKFKLEYQRKYRRSPTKEDVNLLLNRFVDNTYILAEAVYQGLEQDEKMEKEIQRTFRYILTQPGGLLYKEIVENNVMVSHSEIKEAYEKNNKILHFEYLKFKSIEELSFKIAVKVTPYKKVIRSIEYRCCAGHNA